MAPSAFDAALAERGISRREFLRFCSMTAALLSLPPSLVPKLAAAIETAKKPSVLWLQFQECTGDTESFLRASRPAAGDIILDLLSVDYHETIMAPAGRNAEKSLAAGTHDKGKYIAIVEGAIPVKDDGIYCCIGGKSAIAIAREVCGGAAATICVGSCASFGGIAAASPNPTGAAGVGDALGINTLNLAGCPVNAANITATIVHYLAFGRLPETDGLGRPLFAYGKRIHDNCERRPHFDAGQFVREWGDEGHRKGWCLYEMGCKGPQAYMNCPTVRYNDGVSWPVMGGHPCFACGAPRNWDEMTPLYRRLPGVPGAGLHRTMDHVGIAAAAAATAGVAVHILGRIIKGKGRGIETVRKHQRQPAQEKGATEKKEG